MPFCSKCGVRMDDGVVFCPICGTTSDIPAPPPLALQPVYVPPLFAPDTQGAYYVPQMIVPMRMKNTTVAAVLSLLIAGAGQIYAGRAVRGLGILALISLIGFTGYAVFNLLGLLLVVPFIIGIFAWQIYDAYSLARKFNEHTRTYARPPW